MEKNPALAGFFYLEVVWQGFAKAPKNQKTLFCNVEAGIGVCYNFFGNKKTKKCGGTGYEKV